MGDKPTRTAKKGVAKAGGAAARARGNGESRVDWRARIVPARVTDPAEARRVMKRAASRIKTTAKVDTVHPDS